MIKILNCKEELLALKELIFFANQYIKIVLNSVQTKVIVQVMEFANVYKDFQE
jgi:hypothetical protein